jgi:cytochrome c-type biogenesis protein CcmH
MTRATGLNSRREFLRRAAGSVAGSATLLVSSNARAQQPGARGMTHDSSMVKDSTNLFAMDQSAALPVRLPPKPNAKPVMTDKERDALEHRIHCQCGCTLDVYTCRTTDFSCRVSPSMHRDVSELVRGGYDAQEIIDAFVNVYGERALMAPKTSGFQLLAWIVPGTTVLIAGIGIAMLIKRWGARAKTRAATSAAFVAEPVGTDATSDELARLEAAVRGEDNA